MTPVRKLDTDAGADADKPKPYTIAVAIYAKHRSKKDAFELACADLKRAALKDAALMDALLDGVLDDACRQLIRAVASKERRVHFAAPPSLSTEAMQRHADTVRQAGLLLDIALPDHTLLRYATRQKVEDAASVYGSQSRTMAVQERFLLLLAPLVKPGKTVGECVTEKQAAALRERAHKEIAERDT